MKTFAIFYYEGNREVCWTVKAMTEDEARVEFEYELASGNVEHFNDKKGYTISECH